MCFFYPFTVSSSCVKKSFQDVFLCDDWPTSYSKSHSMFYLCVDSRRIASYLLYICVYFSVQRIQSCVPWFSYFLFCCFPMFPSSCLSLSVCMSISLSLSLLSPLLFSLTVIRPKCASWRRNVGLRVSSSTSCQKSWRSSGSRLGSLISSALNP